jgi:hypothetical protein
MTRMVACGLVIVFCASPLHAQSLRDAASRAAVEATAQPASPDGGKRMPRGLFWTGIGLLGAGGLYLAIGAAAGDEEACVTISRASDCVSIRKVALITGGVMAGTGGALLAIGASKSRHSPTVSFLPGGVVVRQQVPLTFPRHR